MKERSLQSLKDSVAPLQNLTDSEPHVKQLRHNPAAIKRVDYDFDDDIHVPYDAPYTAQDGSIDSETDVQAFVLRILESLARCYSTKISFSQNRRITGIECDILLLYGKNRIPFSAVEIKKNGGPIFVQAIFEDGESVDEKLKGKVQGENLAQLQQIQLFGFDKVFGLISDGNHSMITCTGAFGKTTDLPTTSPDATPNNKHSAHTMEEHGVHLSPDNAVTFVKGGSIVAAISKKIGSRLSTPSLYCSGYSSVIHENGSVNWEPTIKLLAHFLMLALNSVDPHQFCHEIPINKKLPARIIHLSKESSVFAHTTIEFDSKPDLGKCLLSSSAISKILLFKHLGMGANGDCCLATTQTKKKSFCAVKFFADRKSALDCAKEECSFWTLIYDELPKARVVKLPPTDDVTGNKDVCLCMPYLIPIDAKERSEALGNGSIKKCLQDFARKGYHHMEVLWRHLGVFGSRSERKVYLCDLGNLKKRGARSDKEWEEETETWVEACLSSLTKTAYKEKESFRSHPIENYKMEPTPVKTFKKG